MRPKHTRHAEYLRRCPADWARSPISELGEVQAGRQRSPHLKSGKPRPYLRVANVFDGHIDTQDLLSMRFTDQEFSRYRLRAGDILLNEGQSLHLVGRAAMYDGTPSDVAFQNTLIRFRSGRSIERDFALDTFRHFQSEGIFSEVATQTTSIAHLGVSRFAFLKVALPPRGEQRKIAAILSSVDKAIGRTQAVIDQLGILKEAMTHELLTGGIPGRGAQSKRTELGEIPRGWGVVTLADVAPPDRPCAQTGPFGAQLSPAEFVDQGVPVLKIGNVKAGRMDLSKLDYVTEAKAAELYKYRVEAGDLLFARQGATTGRNALADARCEGSIFSYHVIRVATDRKRCTPEYLSACFNSALIQRQVGREKARGNRDGINTANMIGFRFPLPPIEEQHEITTVLGAVEQSRVANEGQLAQLRSLRSALRSALLTGEVRVTPDPEPSP
jgi:type I restriction enzyme S subunit